MNDQSVESIPDGLELPIQLASDQSQYVFWGGEAELGQDSRTQNDNAETIFCMHPAPEFRFEFGPHTTSDLLETWFELELGEATINCGESFGEVVCYVTNSGTKISGYLEPQTQTVGTKAVAHNAFFIVINGLHVHGGPMKRGNSSFTGRLQSGVDGHNIVVDALKTDPTQRNVVYEPTHVASCEFAKPVNVESIDEMGSHLFRVLSLMKCRWVGLPGPWICDFSRKLIELRLFVTKTCRNGGAISWYHKMVRSSFHDLFKSMYCAFQDETRGPALQTASHWLVESEQSAGGVEGPSSCSSLPLNA